MAIFRRAETDISRSKQRATLILIPVAMRRRAALLGQLKHDHLGMAIATKSAYRAGKTK